MNLTPQTQAIIRKVEAIGYRVEVKRVKGRTTIRATTANGDEELGIAATPYEAAVQLLTSVLLTRVDGGSLGGKAKTIVQHITELGYQVSIDRSHGAIEMVAVDVGNVRHVVRVDDVEVESDHECAILLAEMVGIELEDG